MSLREETLLQHTPTFDCIQLGDTPASLYNLARYSFTRNSANSHATTFIKSLFFKSQIMKFAILAGLAAVASAASPAVLERQLLSPYPMVPVLPVPGYNNSPDGFNSLGSIYTSSAGQLSSQANALGRSSPLSASSRCDGISTRRIR